jgi:hypothetical protein
MDAPKKNKKLKIEDLTESNKMLTPKYVNEIEVEILVDVNTSKGHFKKGQIKILNLSEGQYLISKGLGKEHI